VGPPPLGYTSCEDCRGSGKNENGDPCPKCKGTRLVAVVEPEYAEDEKKRATGHRRFPRYVADLPITVTRQQSDLEGYCNQIAEGGLGAFLSEEVPVGSVVLLQLAVPPDSTRLHAQAVVRYQIGFQHGLEFLSLDEAERAAIRKFCKELPSVTTGR